MKKLDVAFIAVGFALGCILTMLADDPNISSYIKPKVQVMQTIIYDTLPDQGILNRDKYKLPEPYRLFRDSTQGNQWVAAYHYNDIKKDMYLAFVGEDHIMTTVFFGLQYADHFKTPGEVVKLVKQNWQEVLANRAARLPRISKPIIQ